MLPTDAETVRPAAEGFFRTLLEANLWAKKAARGFPSARESERRLQHVCAALTGQVSVSLKGISVRRSPARCEACVCGVCAALTGQVRSLRTEGGGWRMDGGFLGC